MKQLTLAVVFLFTTVVTAVDAPKLSEARDAEHEYKTRLKYAQVQLDTVVNRAEKEYAFKAAEAKRQYIARLRKALSIALKAQNLDEANRINARIKALLEDQFTAGTLDVKTARWGLPKREIDVKDIVESLSDGKKMELQIDRRFNAKKGDPAPGHKKTLTLDLELPARKIRIQLVGDDCKATIVAGD